MLSITELRYGQCKYPVSDEIPPQKALSNDMPFARHLFCGDPVVDPNDVKCVYCATHHALCFKGAGKDWQALEVMLKKTEKTVTYITGGQQKSPEATPELPEILSQNKKADVA